MAQASSNTIHGSRLVRFLREMAVSDVELTQDYFSQNLGQYISFSDSVVYADMLGRLQSTRFEPSGASPPERIQERFLRTQASMVEFVVQSFIPGSGSHVRLPAEKKDPTEMTVEPYLRFYAAHQREFDFKIQRLQSDIRDALTEMSPRLAQLVILDKTLGGTLAAQSRKAFSVLPGLIKNRFDYYFKKTNPQKTKSGKTDSGRPDCNTHDQPITLPDHWLAPFYSELQGLLLAELEVRLLPVLGLTEAVNEQSDKN